MPRGQHGRVAQRRRTRQAILAAATRLLSRGTTPSIDEVATEADVSRRTIYMYFPTVEQLLTDAIAGMLSASEIDRSVSTSGDARERVESLARSLLDAADVTLLLGRRLIRLTVELPPRPTKQPRVRGHRRAAWVASAIEPLRSRLSKEQHDRLAAALMVLLGWEAMIVLRDLCGLDRAAETRVLTWASRALVDAMLAERSTAPARRRKRRSRS